MMSLYMSAVLATAAASVPMEMEQVKGSTEQCIGGKVHKLDYYANMTSSASFVDLDGSLGSDLRAVSCDIDHTRLTLSFKHQTDALKWIVKFNDFDNHFIVGGANWNCTAADAIDVNRPTYILRRVVGASESAHLGKDITVTTAMARYDEVFETADIKYGSTGACDAAEPKWADGPVSVMSVTKDSEGYEAEPVDKKICLGYNTDCSGPATKPLPLFSNSHVDVTCTDCYADLETDLFVDVSISGWKVKNLRGGFANATLNASMVVDAKATKNWNVAIDKTLPIAEQTYLLNFKIGSVPFMLYFSIPMEVVGSLEFDTAAELTVGSNAGLPLGDLYVAWDPTHHWTHSFPKPDYAHAVAPKLSMTESAEIAVTGQLQLKPAFNLHFDRIFSFSVNANAQLNANVHGGSAKKQTCLSSTYDLDVVASSEVDINIDLIDFHKDWKWGPVHMYNKSGTAIPEKCIEF
jgi:hypothetical protein